MTTTYRIHGITDDTDTCEVCGKTELRSVVMLAVVEADGDTGELIYAGTSCAARKLATRGRRTTAAKVRDAAGAAARVHAEARAYADEMEGLTFNAYLKANWTAAENFGVQFIRDAFDEMTVDVATIRAGGLPAHFAARLPKI